jgi:Methyltransferase FkbM domain
MLDELSQQLEGHRAGLIKIDVEGLEMEVIAGGQALLKRDRPVLFVEIISSSRRRRDVEAAPSGARDTIRRIRRRSRHRSSAMYRQPHRDRMTGAVIDCSSVVVVSSCFGCARPRPCAPITMRSAPRSVVRFST